MTYDFKAETDTIRHSLSMLQRRFPGVDIGVIAAEEMLAGRIGDLDRGRMAVYVLTGKLIDVLPNPTKPKAGPRALCVMAYISTATDENGIIDDEHLIELEAGQRTIPPHKRAAAWEVTRADEAVMSPLAVWRGRRATAPESELRASTAAVKTRYRGKYPTRIATAWRRLGSKTLLCLQANDGNILDIHVDEFCEFLGVHGLHQCTQISDICGNDILEVARFVIGSRADEMIRAVAAVPV